MNKEDLIYDAIIRLEKRLDNDLLCIKKDVNELKEFRSRVLGYFAGVMLVGSLVVSYIKYIINKYNIL